MGALPTPGLLISAKGEVAEFERLIEVADCDLLAWITGEQAVPSDFDSALFRDLRRLPLASRRRREVNMAQSPAELLRPGRPLTLADVADGAQGLIVADLARAVAARADAPATSLLVCAATERAWRRSRARSASSTRALQCWNSGLGLPAL